ncbi:HAD family hydrolase [Streptomyces pathocidini]|uniref:HAD family hydrolase n=1 Tax=Streptomyces pathocidini TaxID=1650571 RepID=A0ABW7UV07_9ACTN|nr:HAD family phosphatase [Streptomyces pathocidini]
MKKDPLLAWTPAAVVFDCDGTLMDTERHWEHARELVRTRHELADDPEFPARTKGLHYTDCGRLLADSAGRPDLADRMARELLDAFTERVAEDPATAPGAVELVGMLGRFAPLAIASNCPRDVVEFCLGTAGLLDYFEHIVVPGDGVLPKPHPDPYASAARLLGAEPTDSLAVEDSLCGIMSAARAGLRVIGVGPHPEGEEQALVDLWVSSLAEPELLTWAGTRIPRQTRGG